MSLVKNISLILVLFSVLSCNKIPVPVKKALNYAGANKRELEKVIDYYKETGDTQKLRAAYFLIANIPSHFSYKGELLDYYYNYFHEATVENPSEHDSIFNAYVKKYGPLDKNRLTKVYDIKNVTSEYLISNINHAFMVWRDQPWGKDIGFQIFCEYILPYRLGDEKLEYWQDSLYLKYNPLLDSLRQNNGKAVEACAKVNKTLKEYIEGIVFNIGVFPCFTVSEIKNMKYITCREQANIAAYAMRSVGIPVSIDYTPQWPFRSLGHTWNAVFDEKGKTIHFMGTETAPGEVHKDSWKKAKVYRKTFSKNSKSLAEVKKVNEQVPDLFNDPHFIDVTELYAVVKDISINIKQNFYIPQEKYVYICVFDNQNWVPIHWSKNKRKEVKFDKMGMDIVYLVMYYLPNGLKPASDPFILTKQGDIKYLKPENSELQNFVLKRKYPLKIHYYDSRIVGAKFEAANKPDFSDADTLYVVNEFPGPYYTKVNINSEKKYRYARYITYKGGFANIAELEFYDDNNNELTGEIIGTPGSWRDKPTTKDKAFDKNVLTFFDAPVADSASVGLDFGKPEKINAIRFLPRNDGNSIEPGDDYELMYWNDQWISCGSQAAICDSLIYKFVPSGALYILHNKTKGKEERIFTYENNEQIWW